MNKIKAYCDKCKQETNCTVIQIHHSENAFMECECKCDVCGNIIKQEINA